MKPRAARVELRRDQRRRSRSAPRLAGNVIPLRPPAPVPDAQSMILAHGRFIADARPERTWLGVLYRWTVEDLDSDDLTVVATGLAADLDIVALEVRTAVLREVRLTNLQATNPVMAAMLREAGS